MVFFYLRKTILAKFLTKKKDKHTSNIFKYCVCKLIKKCSCGSILYYCNNAHFMNALIERTISQNSLYAYLIEMQGAEEAMLSV